MSVEPFWTEINESSLRQGDYLPGCLVPVFAPDLAVAGTHEITAGWRDARLFDAKCEHAARDSRP